MKTWGYLINVLDSTLFLKPIVALNDSGIRGFSMKFKIGV